MRLVPDQQVVEVVEFETADPAMQGEMTITYTLADEDGGTIVLGVHQGLPPGVSREDNETGWRMSLDKLAALVEAGTGPPAADSGGLKRRTGQHRLGRVLHRQRLAADEVEVRPTT